MRGALALILLKLRIECRRRGRASETRGGPMNDRTAYSAWMLCFLAGGLAGASVAVLLAPQSGKATRDGVRRRLRETADSARGLKERIVRQGEAVRDEAGRRVGAAASALAGNGEDGVASA
jgi:YtxH-like protein